MWHPQMQRKGIEACVIRALLSLAAQQCKPGTLAVMKINPALALYERLGLRITHEDEHKFYMRANPKATEDRAGRAWRSRF